MDINIVSLIEQQVQRELEDMDLRGIIEDQLRKTVASEAGKQMVGAIKQTAEELIREEITNTLNGKVETNDGWGKKESYPSFEDMFRKTFKAKMDSTYEVKKEIEKLVKARVDLLMKQESDSVIERIVDTLTQSRLTKKA